jgi:hypothetical protein
MYEFQVFQVSTKNNPQTDYQPLPRIIESSPLDSLIFFIHEF